MGGGGGGAGGRGGTILGAPLPYTVIGDRDFFSLFLTFSEYIIISGFSAYKKLRHRRNKSDKKLHNMSSIKPRPTLYPPPSYDRDIIKDSLRMATSPVKLSFFAKILLCRL